MEALEIDPHRIVSVPQAPPNTPNGLNTMDESRDIPIKALGIDPLLNILK